jgi:hypothetical protein
VQSLSLSVCNQTLREAPAQTVCKKESCGLCYCWVFSVLQRIDGNLFMGFSHKDGGAGGLGYDDLCDRRIRALRKKRFAERSFGILDAVYVHRNF